MEIAHPNPMIPSTLLARLLDDFRTAGVRPSRLAILSKATDDGFTDADVSVLVDELATCRSLDAVDRCQTRDLGDDSHPEG